MRHIAWLGLLLASAVLAPGGFAYIRQQVFGTTIPLVRVDNAAIPFFLNNQIVPGYQSSVSGSAIPNITSDSNPQQAARKALASWNAVGTVSFLPLQTTAAVIDSTDYQATIAFGSTSSDLSYLGSALAITIDTYVTGPANKGSNGPVVCSSNCTYPAAGDIYDSDIILNPGYTFSTTGTAGSHDLQSTLLHEFGHSLGANHTGLLGASMFQYPSNRFLTTDDLAFVNSAYPLPAGGAALGTISGTVTVAGGGPVPYALLTAVDTSAGVTVGGYTNPDGTYSFQVPPGNYQLYAEPLNGVVPINIYLTSAQASLAAGTQFQTTLYRGSLTVAENGIANANIAVTAGASSLAAPFVAVTPVNGSASSAVIGGPVTVPSGQPVDLVLSGPGFDSTLSNSNFTFYGEGVMLKPGSVRVDSSQTFSGFPLLRLTLNVAATATPSLAGFTVTSGSNTSSFSAALVIVPPTPTTTLQGVVSAASELGGGVSPGEYVAVYGNGLGPTGGPVFGGFENNGFDSYGFLPTTLAGVSVTFDGVPAPIFYLNGQDAGASYGQINLQVPFEVAGRASTQVVVNFLGSASSAVPVPVLTSHPAFFTTGLTTAAYIVNQNGSLNTAANPAAPGDVATVYGTGVGALPSAGYPLETGAAAPTPLTFSSSGFTCSTNGINAPVTFAGWTPTIVAVAQWNVQIPPSLTTTGAVPIVCSSGAGATQPDLTVFVK